MNPELTWHFETPRRVTLIGGGRAIELRFECEGEDSGWDVLVDGRVTVRRPTLADAQDEALALAVPEDEGGIETALPLLDLLEPILDAPEGDESGFDQAIGDVAEALAMSEPLMVDAEGRPVHGVTDEEAVLWMLGAYGNRLMRQGAFDDALGVAALMDRVAEHARRPTRRAA